MTVPCRTVALEDDEKLPIKMLNDRVLVRIPEKDGERRSSGGILIPATAQISKRLVWAEVVALVEQHLDQVAAHTCPDWRVVFYLKPRLGGLCAGRNAAPARFHRADPAAALMAQALVVAKAGNVDARCICGLHDGLAGLGRQRDAVNVEQEGLTHLLKSLSKI